MDRVGHPAAWLHLVAVQAPVLELLLKEWPADIGGVVQLTRPVQHTNNHTLNNLKVLLGIYKLKQIHFINIHIYNNDIYIFVKINSIIFSN